MSLSTISQGIKRAGLEGDFCPPTGTEIKEGANVPPLAHKSRCSGVQFIKYRNNFV
jgi:hypothetical protein